MSAGQLIAELDPTTLSNAYTISKTALDQAQDTYNRMKELHDAGSLPEMQWIQIDNQLKSAKAQEAMAKKSLTETKLYAPFSGYIAEKYADVEDFVIWAIPISVIFARISLFIGMPRDIHNIPCCNNSDYILSVGYYRWNKDNLFNLILTVN